MRSGFSRDPNWGDYGKDYYEQDGMSRRDWLAGHGNAGVCIATLQNLVSGYGCTAEQAGIDSARHDGANVVQDWPTP